MTSNIYFRSALDRPWYWNTVRTASFLSHTLLPNSSSKLLRRLFSQPTKSSPARSTNLQLKLGSPSFFITTEHGQLAVYQKGQGPAIVFQHGWSGCAAQLSQLMHLAAAAGYTAVAFDHYNHGASVANEANIPLFAIATQSVLRELKARGLPIAGFASHSIGVMATLNAIRSYETPHFMVAPLMDAFDVARRQLIGIGVTENQLNHIFRSVEETYGVDHSRMLRMRDMPLNVLHAKILHCKDDPIASVHHSQSWCVEQRNLELITLPGKSHTRILSSPQTLKAFQSWIRNLPPASHPILTHLPQAKPASSANKEFLGVAPLW